MVLIRCLFCCMICHGLLWFGMILVWLWYVFNLVSMYDGFGMASWYGFMVVVCFLVWFGYPSGCAIIITTLTTTTRYRHTDRGEGGGEMDWLELLGRLLNQSIVLMVWAPRGGSPIIRIKWLLLLLPTTTTTTTTTDPQHLSRWLRFWHSRKTFWADVAKQAQGDI